MMSTDWSFHGYEKIGESLHDWLGDDEAAIRALKRVEWIVTEKIHGANFCLVTDGIAVRAAKRKVFLDADDDFFGHEAVLAELADAVRRTFALARARDPRVVRIFVYGELFGGGYPHSEVAADPTVQPVQTGVWYAPGIRFCAFDLGLVRGGVDVRDYADHDDVTSLLAEAGIPSAAPLFRGSYADAIAFPLGFETTIPATLGLPALGPTNKAEGVVIKPARTIVLRDGRAVRPVVKRKIHEFAEDARFQGAEKWSPRRAQVGGLEVLKREASSRMTDARLDAAISKLGRLESGSSRADIVRLVIDDVYDELSGAQSLPGGERERLHQFVEAEACALADLYLERLVRSVRSA